MTLSQAIVERILEFQNDKKITTNKLATLSGLSQATVRDITYGVSKFPKINSDNGNVYDADYKVEDDK